VRTLGPTDEEKNNGTRHHTPPVPGRICKYHDCGAKNQGSVLVGAWAPPRSKHHTTSPRRGVKVSHHVVVVVGKDVPPPGGSTSRESQEVRTAGDSISFLIGWGCYVA
jgi:hypothetical protein